MPEEIHVDAGTAGRCCPISLLNPESVRLTLGCDDVASAAGCDAAPTVAQQAVQLERLLPALIRRLFTLDPDHPATDLPVAQLRVCSILQSGAKSMTALSDELGISMSAMTQIADRMERSGLAQRTAGAEDRRVKNLQLTAQGEQMMQSRRALRVQRAARVLETMPELERAQILQTLQDLLRRCELVGHDP